MNATVKPFADQARTTFPNVNVRMAPEPARTLICDRHAAGVQIVRLAAPGVRVELDGTFARENGLGHFVKFAWQMRGSAQIRSARGGHTLSGGEAMLLPLCETYEYEADRRHDALFLVFSTGDHPAWRDLAERRPVSNVKPGSAIAAAQAGIAALMAHAGGSRSDAIVVEACLEMMRFALSDGADQAGRAADKVLLREATLLIEQNIGDPAYGPEALARSLGRSRRSLYRVFEGLGLSPGRYIQQLRLSRAKSDIVASSNDQGSFTEIAFRYGFADSSSFSHAFRRHYGVAPSALRRRSRSEG